MPVLVFIYCNLTSNNFYISSSSTSTMNGFSFGTKFDCLPFMGFDWSAQLDFRPPDKWPGLYSFYINMYCKYLGNFTLNHGCSLISLSFILLIGKGYNNLFIKS